MYIIPLYFGFAVGYDVYNTIRDIVLEQTGASQGKVITQGIIGVAKNMTESPNLHNFSTTISALSITEISTVTV